MEPRRERCEARTDESLASTVAASASPATRRAILVEIRHWPIIRYSPLIILIRSDYNALQQCRNSNVAIIAETERQAARKYWVSRAPVCRFVNVSKAEVLVAFVVTTLRT